MEDMELSGGRKSAWASGRRARGPGQHPMNTRLVLRNFRTAPAHAHRLSQGPLTAPIPPAAPPSPGNRLLQAPRAAIELFLVSYFHVVARPYDFADRLLRPREVRIANATLQAYLPDLHVSM